jgi:DNA-binding FrmR family transcriptional regulator
MKHVSHPSVAARLKRANGHLAAVIAMLEQGRPCLDLAQQIHAVANAIENAKRALIQDHIEHCLGDGGASAKTAISELRQLAKYL